MSRNCEVYALESSGKYQNIEPRDGKITSTVLPNFWIKIEWLWPDTRPKALDALRQLGVL
jgi:hypothetical protein